MSLDRDELAARFAVALAGNANVTEQDSGYDRIVSNGVALADQFLLALTPPAAQPVTEASPADAERAVVAAARAWGNSEPRCSCEGTEEGRVLIDAIIALPDAVPPVAPKSEAAKYEPEAPVHARIGDTIRVTRLKGREWTYQVHSVTPQGFAVNRAFYENSREEPQYGEYVGDYEILTKGPLWPATPPAPVEPAKGEARDEAFKALLAYAECDYAYCYERPVDWRAAFQRHGWIDTENSGDWLRALCERALALARTVRS